MDFKDLIVFKIAPECDYINQELHNSLYSECEEIGKLLNYMLDNPDKFRSSKAF